MTDEQKAAYVIGEAVAAFVECQAMMQVNKEREAKGQGYTYGEEDFMKLHEHHCICHNSTLSLFHG